MEKLLTVPQLWDLLQVKKGLVYKWGHYGFVLCMKMGNVLRFMDSQIERWIEIREKRGRLSYKLSV